MRISTPNAFHYEQATPTYTSHLYTVVFYLILTADANFRRRFTGSTVAAMDKVLFVIHFKVSILQQ